MDLQDITIECQTGFCAVLVSALDDQPIGSSRRCLITAVARAENSGQLWNDTQTKLLERGRAPVLVEPVVAALTLKTHGRVAVHALEATGAVRDDLPTRAVAGGVVLTLGPAARTCFFGVEVE